MQEDKGTNMVTKNDILDFSDLGKSITFIYGENRYKINPVTPATAQQIVNIQNEMGSIDQNGDDDPNDLNNKFLNLSYNLITIVTTKDDGGELSSDEFMKKWPLALIHKVMGIITEQLSGAMEEEKESKN